MIHNLRFIATRPVGSSRSFCWLMVIALLAIGGCSSDRPERSGQVGDAYARVIQWFVDRSGDDSDQTLVFVQARGEGFSIDLETQAAIVESTQSFADVRFIDDQSEALDEGGVRDGGLLLAIGPAVPDGANVVIECDEYVTEDVTVGRSFDLRFVAGEWVLTGEPTELAM